MKKTIAILLVLVIGMVGVWAAFTNTTAQTLNLTTTIASVNAFAITTADYSDNSFWSVFGTSGSESPADTSVTRTVDIDDGIQTSYLTIGTNNVGGFSVYLNSATTMTIDGSGTGSEIDYEITVGDAIFNTADTSSNVQLAATVSAVAGAGAKVESYEILVNLDEESYYNAEATVDDEVYQSTVIFGITAI